jgi:hypothetical protein
MGSGQQKQSVSEKKVWRCGVKLNGLPRWLMGNVNDCRLPAAVLPDVYASADAARKDFDLRSSRGETSIYTPHIDVSPRERSKLRSAQIKASGRRYSISALVDPERAANFIEIVRFI